MVQLAESHSAVGADSYEPIRVLLLEDNLTDAELIISQLGVDGMEFVHHVISDELELRREIAEFAPHIILSDFSLPGFDGLSALAVAQSLVAATPFIFVSGTIGEERAIEALKKGAADYVLKENLSRLVPAVRNAIRQAELAKARDIAEQMLKRSESRLQDIINTSMDWIWECDAEACFAFSSASITDMLGYTRHEVLGRSSFSYVEAEDHPQLEKALNRLHDGAEQIGPITLRWTTKDGGARWLERKMIALRSDGNLHGIRGIDRDVTTRITQEARIARLNRALRFLSGANDAIVRIRNRRDLLKETCRLAVQNGGYGMATVYMLPTANETDAIVYRAVSRRQSDTERPPREPLKGDGPVARVLTTGEPVLVHDLAEEAGSVPGRASLLAMGLRSCVALPIVVDGTTVGVVQLHSDESEVLTDAELALLHRVMGNITFSLQYLHSKESAQYLEYFDTLTTLANRTLYRQRLDDLIQGAQQRNAGLALLVFDIAGLAVINDGIGYHAGDLVLQLTAERLKNAFGDSTSLCRLGGGSYAVAATDTEHGSAATVLRERVDYLFDEPFVINDQELRVSIKAGIAQFPDDGGNADALMAHAQTALARAKQEGEHYLRHSPAMNVQASERLDLTNRLREIVAAQKFQLHYQPKVDARTGGLAGAEALLRWPESVPGPTSPAVFVPMLESLGLIDSIGRWVIGQALTDAAGWANGDGGVTVAVNVSPLQLKRVTFVDEVLEILDALPDGGAVGLELEVTESMLMADPRRAGAMLGRLRESGVSIAIDDFGTGHSSLRVLSQLPIDVLKIDRGFVRDIANSRSDRLIVQTALTLATSLGMRTVAEGVETQQQVDVLTELGCDVLQGYFIQHPVGTADFTDWLAARTAAQAGARQDRPEAQGDGA